MGMDIYGIKPKQSSPRPELDFSGASEEVRKVYFEELRKWEEENAGSYFRANLWSWRPIQIIIETVKDLYKLDIDTSEFGYNSGGGLTTQEECDTLANSMEEFISKDKNFKEGDDQIYLNLGMWSSYEGTLSISEEMQDELNSQYPIGSVMYNAVVATDGTLVVPAWSTSRSHVEKFIQFLRNCGGFEIW